MSVSDKTTIKSYFKTGDIPTQSNFTDLIDSYTDTVRPVLQDNLYTKADNGEIFLGKIKLTQNNIQLTNVGNIWVAKDSVRDWISVSMSSDGRYQTAVVYNGQIYISDDYGATWTAVESARLWYSVSMSSDGRYQTAVVYTGQIYISDDYGATWTAVESTRNWILVSMSSDGRYQTAVVFGGQIYISDDYGATWTAVNSTRDWYSVSMSSDGRYQTAVVYNGQIYISDDYGATWTAVDSARVWYSVSMSSDGRYQTAVVDNGQIWISKADELINGNLIADSFEGDGSKLTGIAPSPINLDYAFSLTPDVDDGLLRTTTLTGNVTLNAPTSPVAGAVWEWYVTADGTNRNLSLHVDIKIPSDSAFTSPKILTANKTYILQLRYVGSSWCLTSLVGGF